MQQLPKCKDSTHAWSVYLLCVCVLGVGQRSSSRGSSPEACRVAMERAQASVSSGSSTPVPSNPIITSSSSSNNSQGMTSVSSSISSSVSASTRQQTLPQISVYGGIPDRQTVQVGALFSVSAKLMIKWFPSITRCCVSFYNQGFKPWSWGLIKMRNFKFKV